MKKILMAIILCLFPLSVWSSAHANLMLRLSDGVNPVVNLVDGPEGALDRVGNSFGPIGDWAALSGAGHGQDGVADRTL